MNDEGDDFAYSPIVNKYNLLMHQQELSLNFVTQEVKSLITGMGIILIDNNLVVFSSMTGHGMTVGAVAKTNGQIWNGFMTWVNHVSGTINLSNYRSEMHNSHGTPIRSQCKNYVFGICMEKDKAYVVGSTMEKFKGTIGGSRFV